MSTWTCDVQSFGAAGSGVGVITAHEASSLRGVPVTTPKFCCPACESYASKVTDTRPANRADGVVRRRECRDCHTRFTTYEQVIATIHSPTRTHEQQMR